MLFSCGASQPAAPQTSAPTAAASAPAETNTRPPESSAQAPAQPASPQTGKANTAATIQGIEFRRERELAVYSIGLADPPLVAVLGAEPEMRGKQGWKQLAIPKKLRPQANESQNIEIYFGRDNRPRIMGTRHTAEGPVNVYWRYVATGWRDGREEIGKLGAPRGGLYGVLGLDDPEVVCRAGDQCIIKRLSGWKTIPAGPEPRLVSVRENTAWSLDSSGVSALGQEAWKVFAERPPYKKAAAFWSDGTEAWVSADNKLFQFTGGHWQEAHSPLSTISAFWGANKNEIWSVGANGAALFDGKQWARIAGAPEQLRTVNARKDELWVGGDTGLFQVIRSAK